MNKYIFSILFFILLMNGCDIIKNNTSKDYFPLKKNSVYEYNIEYNLEKAQDDNTRYFFIGLMLTAPNKSINNILPGRLINGQKLTPMSEKAGNNLTIYFYKKDKNGVAIEAIQYQDDINPIFLKNPLYLIKYPIKNGIQWKEEMTNKVPFIGKVDFKVTRKIDKQDDVVVLPIKTYNNCVRVIVDGYAIKNKNYKIKNILWFAPNIGLVKAIFREKLFNDSGGEVFSFVRIMQLMKMSVN